MNLNRFKLDLSRFARFYKAFARYLQGFVWFFLIIRFIRFARFLPGKATMECWPGKHDFQRCCEPTKQVFISIMHGADFGLRVLFL